jgi:hypothetical protein
MLRSRRSLTTAGGKSCRPDVGPRQETEGAGAGERQMEAVGGRAVSREVNSKGCRGGKLLSPEWIVAEVIPVLLIPTT